MVPVQKPHEHRQPGQRRHLDDCKAMGATTVGERPRLHPSIFPGDLLQIAKGWQCHAIEVKDARKEQASRNGSASSDFSRRCYRHHLRSAESLFENGY